MNAWHNCGSHSEQFAAVKTKLCDNKAVDVADLEENGMHSVVAAMQRMKWTRMVTISEASYPDLVKAFYTYLKSKANGSLTYIVKGIPIHITYDLLESLLGVSTSGHSGVDNVDIHVKGLGIIGTEYKLKDGKIDINQLNAFNRNLHFIVCQILVPRSATFSTCPKADSDMMFWAIQNQDINMAEVIIERIKFATAMLWDKKNKLNMSLPYAHLLTRIFQHYNIDLSGEVSEMMGQAIRSRNLKKSGFSLTKTSVAEGEAIIGEAQEVPIPEVEAEAEVRAEDPIAEAPAAPTVLEEAAAAVRPEEPMASPRRIEEIPPEHIEPVRQSSEVDTPTTVITSILHEVLDIVASIQGEHVAEMAADVHGEPAASPHIDQFQEGVVESTSDEDEVHVDNVEPVAGTSDKGKPRNEEAIWSSGTSNAKEVRPSGTSNAKEVRPSGPIGVEDSGPSGPKVVEQSSQDQPAQGASRPPGPSIEQAGPPGPVVDESGPSGPVESQDEHGRVEAPVEEAVPPEPPTSPLQTPAPPSPPSSTTAPPAPATFKQPLPKNISSPTPFPTTTSSSPVSSTFIPPPPFEAPLASSSAGASSSGPSSDGPSVPPPSTSYSFLYPPTPPSFVTIIPEGAQLEGPFMQDIKDKFEVAILRSVLSVGTHIHRTGSSSHGHLKSDVLAPLLSECKRLSPSDWERHYPLTAQQLLDLNASQARSNQLPLSATEFLDLNSIHLVRDPFDMWVERYKVYVSMKKELKHQQIFYPISIDQFLQHASFGTSSTYKMSLGKDEYGNFVEAQRQLHIPRMAPIMGPSYSMVYGAFQGYFEE
ncbi:hypothetical protein Taro_024674 [Colocasia esculenta]|uniref:Putative plant transposon protein domain-containing protein n=1 Tax=Colocasia esculenta TaxID=4460 RepID=A0A843VF76_COLES|nr:hypothetical protein [Colocasia esculenta]